MTNDQIPMTVGRYMRTMKMMHTALVAGMVIFAAVAVILLGTGAVKISETENLHTVFQFLVPLAAIGGFLSSNMLFKKRLDSINGSAAARLGQRLQEYRAASIIRWALLEGAILLATIGLMLTGRYFFYGPIIFVLLVFFLMYAPAEEKIKAQVQMSSSEQALLDDDYAEIE